MEEQWKDIAGYEGRYRISSLGRVYSVPRVVMRKHKGKLVAQPWKGGVLVWTEGRARKNIYIILPLRKEGKSKSFYIHRLVAETFLPNPDNLREVNHKDLDKSNNHVDNLEWVSSATNKRHAVNSGVNFNPSPKKGEDCGASKLTEKEVRQIRKRHAKGETAVSLAAAFNVTKTNIRYIIRRLTWKHV